MNIHDVATCRWSSKGVEYMYVREVFNLTIPDRTTQENRFLFFFIFKRMKWFILKILNTLEFRRDAHDDKQFLN